jgi:2-iminobutanoate/2-iminopropanoate deaminase
MTGRPPARRAVVAAGASPPAGAYSHAVCWDGLAFCSMQLGRDPASGAIVQDDVAAEARRCLGNLAAIAEACGAELRDALRVTVHLTDLAVDGPAVDGVFAEIFDHDPPARIAVGVAALPAGARVAIDAIVAAPQPSETGAAA